MLIFAFFASGLTADDQRLEEGEELEVHLRPINEGYAEGFVGQDFDTSLQLAVLMARG